MEVILHAYVLVESPLAQWSYCNHHLIKREGGFGCISLVAGNTKSPVIKTTATSSKGGLYYTMHSCVLKKGKIVLLNLDRHAPVIVIKHCYHRVICEMCCLYWYSSHLTFNMPVPYKFLQILFRQFATMSPDGEWSLCVFKRNIVQPFLIIKPVIRSSLPQVLTNILVWYFF